MKPAVLKIIFVTLVLFGLNGCYTIIWSPDMEFPTEDNSEVTSVYYGDTYYGSYYYYYDYPWWLDIVPPVTRPATTERSDNHEISTLRNTGERGAPPRVPELLPPTKNAPPANTGNTENSNNSGSGNNKTSVRNSTSGSGSSSGRESSSGSSVRNNNGGRSSGGRR